MRRPERREALGAAGLVSAILLAGACPAEGADLGPERFVQSGGIDVWVPGYSVPSLVCWDDDDLEDLVVGEGGAGYTGKVRVYVNVGTRSNPQFSGYVYAESNGQVLSCPASGCLGCFPRLLHWDADGRIDLLVGQSDGTVRLFLNTSADANPTFDGGRFVQVGQPGAKMTIDVGSRATPCPVDWNGDGAEDLVIGAMDGRIRVFLNEGSAGSPDYRLAQAVQASGTDLLVPSGRSSPVVLDLDGDGRKDLVTGNTNGEALFYRNIGTDTAPAFSGAVYLQAGGVGIDLPGWARSRPSACDWTGDGLPDLLVGGSDGKVRLVQGVCPSLGGTGAEGRPAGDFDQDCDTDVDDFVTAFLPCFSGPGVAPPFGCDGPDLDGDGDVDTLDFQAFVLMLTGPIE